MAKKNIVIIGGGSASAGLLGGLYKYRNEYNLAVIGSLADNGGSTGKLQEELGVSALGALRKCLLALSEEGESVKKALAYRFEKGELSGHTAGNILMAALEKTMGSAEKALDQMHRILKVKGEIVPASFEKTSLFAELENGQIIEGETNIDIPRHDGKLKIVKVYLHPAPRVNVHALEKIKKADLIVVGPGDFYTTVIPNLLVDGINEAIKKSKAKKVFVVNSVTKYGETTKFSINDFVAALEKYLGRGVLDCVLYNGANPGNSRIKVRHPEEIFSELVPDKDLLSRYEFIDNYYFIPDSGLPYFDKDKLAGEIIKLL